MSQSTKKQGTSIVLFPLWVFIFCLCLNGCTVLNINSFHFGKLGKKEQGQAVKYEICSGKNMPERLQKIIEERKKKPGTFAYKNSKYTYLVVCYGEKSYSGYSVRVEQCWKDKEQLYLETQLIGPAAGEEVVETLTYPFFVVGGQNFCAGLSPEKIINQPEATYTDNEAEKTGRVCPHKI